ncbi:MAG: DUF2237 domain-containing protein [Bacteroidales bacterium]
MAKNVFGTELKSCSSHPLTGFFRDGSCNTSDEDFGSHTVCVIMTEDFLRFSFDRGNDLITPQPQYQFHGLGPGDQWCLCAARWQEAYDAGFAPSVILEATHERALEIVKLEDLIQCAFVASKD